MNSQVFWYVARSSGLLAWALMTASVVLGIVLGARLIKAPNKAWQTDLHRFLGGLSVVFVAVHVLGIVADSYTHFGLTDVLVPFASSWHPAAVAGGVVAMYLVLAVEVTSLLRKHLARNLWKGVHFASYPMFALTTLHAVTAGTDTRTTVMALVVATGVIVIGALTVARLHAAEAQLDARDERRRRIASATAQPVAQPAALPTARPAALRENSSQPVAWYEHDRSPADAGTSQPDGELLWPTTTSTLRQQSSATVHSP